MVDSFKTKYEGLQIPYPSDGGAMKGEKRCLRVKILHNLFVVLSH